MRLIDADALSELLVKTYETAPTEKALLFVALLLKNNEQVPTVEERPQGEWGKWVISEIRCPNCLAYFQTDCYSTEELKNCPNCGAEMRGAE